MPRITIVITDQVDGGVETICTPPAEELLKEIAVKDGRGVAPSKIYAVRALTAILKLGQESKETGNRIITRLPKRGS